MRCRVSRYTGSIRCIAILASVVALSAGKAIAGPVTFQSGGITVTYFDSDNGEDTKTFPVTFPGATTVSYTGTALDPSTPLGNDRGLAGVTYNLQDLASGAKFDVSTFHNNKGLDQRTLGGSVSFDFAFTTDRPLHYVFTADPTVPSSEFTAKFAGVTQDLHITALGTASGSLLNEGEPVAKTVQGDIAAGPQTFSVFLDVDNGRNNNGGGGSGEVSITLSAAGPTQVPLPPGAWTGLSTFAVAGVFNVLRKIRR